MKRKVRMRKMLREEDLEELLKQVKEKEPAAEAEQDATAPKPEKAATPADKVLELQKRAGNAAVGAVLERFPASFAQRSKLPVLRQLLLGGGYFFIGSLASAAPQLASISATAASRSWPPTSRQTKSIRRRSLSRAWISGRGRLAVAQIS